MNTSYPPVRRLNPIVSIGLGLVLVGLAAAVLLQLNAALGSPIQLASWALPGSGQVAGATGTPRPSSTELIGGGASRSPEPSAAPTPTPTPDPTPALDPRPSAGPFAMDLYRRGDFVEEYENTWCVPAAMQTMINIMSSEADDDVTRGTQAELYAMARKNSPKTLKGAGAEPEGWARSLTLLGHGRYEVVTEPSIRAAVNRAAVAIRMTGRPVGLLTWRGAHSWVMSGFKANADPAFTTKFTVSGVYIEDVWYPRISRIWGESRPPDSLVAVSDLPEDYLKWRRPTRLYPDKDGTYVLVIPVEDAAEG